MGSCASAPEAPGAGVEAGAISGGSSSLCSGGARGAAAAEELPHALRPAACAPQAHQSSQAELFAKVHALQQQLSLLSGHPLLALPEAAELLAEHLDVDVVCIYAYASDRPSCAALMAAHGQGAAVLERRVIASGPDCAAPRLHAAVAAAASAHAPGGGRGGAAAGGRIIVMDMDAAGAQAGAPDEFEALYSEAGIRSFAAATVGPAGGAPLGVLLLGTRRPGCFDDHWASLWLDAAAAGLLQHVRPLQVALAARMLSTIDEVPDPVAAISLLLQSGTRFMWRATNVTMGVRLALLEDRGSHALVFESARAATARGDPRALLAGRTASLPSDPVADVAVREVPLDNTLLASVFAMKKARFVKDCAAYMQNCPTPARDVFTHTSHMVSSLVVVPLLVDDRALGALYFTQDTPCDFSNIQDALLGFVHCVTLTLHNKLSGQMEALRGMVANATKPSKSFEMLSEQAAAAHIIRQLDTTSSSSEDGAAAGADGAPDGGGGGGDGSTVGSMAAPPASSSSRLSKVSSRRVCTEAMLKVLQQEIRKGKRRSVELSFVGDHLVIGDAIGQGGYGCVYRGSWHKRPAAIKVMNMRNNDSEAVSDAMEMAVLSSVQHPNIVQATPAPRTAAGSGGSAGGASRRLHYRRMLPEEDDEGVPSYSIIVMEYMDRGTLGDAVRRGRVFHQQLQGGAVGIDLAAVLDVLIDVAGSLQYLHSISLLHGDVKLDNVLLKSDPLRHTGFVPKLADFGLTKIVRGDDQVVNHSGAGTVTHLAPEMFTAGTRVTTAVDVFAFGTLMWEVYTCRRPWQGLTREGIIDRVLCRGARPHFPAGAPRAYVDLANACWAASPVDRPAIPDILGALQRMGDAAADADAAAAAAAAAAPGAGGGTGGGGPLQAQQPAAAAAQMPAHAAPPLQLHLLQQSLLQQAQLPQQRPRQPPPQQPWGGGASAAAAAAAAAVGGAKDAFGASGESAGAAAIGAGQGQAARRRAARAPGPPRVVRAAAADYCTIAPSRAHKHASAPTRGRAAMGTGERMPCLLPCPYACEGDLPTLQPRGHRHARSGAGQRVGSGAAHPLPTRSRANGSIRTLGAEHPLQAEQDALTAEFLEMLPHEKHAILGTNVEAGILEPPPPCFSARIASRIHFTDKQGARLMAAWAIAEPALAAARQETRSLWGRLCDKAAARSALGAAAEGVLAWDAACCEAAARHEALAPASAAATPRGGEACCGAAAAAVREDDLWARVGLALTQLMGPSNAAKVQLAAWPYVPDAPAVVAARAFLIGRLLSGASYAHGRSVASEFRARPGWAHTPKCAYRSTLTGNSSGSLGSNTIASGSNGSHQAVQERLYEERRRRIRAEQRLTDIEINRRRAAEDRAFERRQRIQEGCIATHKNRLYAAYEKVDKTLFPTYLREGREPGNEFFKAAYREWHANLKAHQARLDSDCESSC
ncbi:MAG: hypothetical protein J3K34DRAFT_459366 [Monoraphidium minutum]|nr:MAG: hypothetical protein J3K34DRAFT_459366 [Monoraphidium minutum]